jgi:SHS2 domain-containing protein
MQSLKLSEANKFEEIEHTADWSYRVWGANLPELFLQAAAGLYRLAGIRLACEPQITREIELKAIDPESLLIAWLNELLYLHESERLGFDQLEIVHLDETTLHARITGAPTEEWVKDIKAVTYHNLNIRETPSGLEVTLVLDV